MHQLCLMPGNLNFLCTFLAQQHYTHSFTCLCVSVHVCANHFEFDLLPICRGFVLKEYSGMALVARPTIPSSASNANDIYLIKFAIYQNWTPNKFKFFKF